MCVFEGMYSRSCRGLSWTDPSSAITSLLCRAATSTGTACRFQGNEHGHSLSTSKAVWGVWVYCVLTWPRHIYIQYMWAVVSVWSVKVCLWYFEPMSARGSYLNAAFFARHASVQKCELDYLMQGRKKNLYHQKLIDLQCLRAGKRKIQIQSPCGCWNTQRR